MYKRYHVKLQFEAKFAAGIPQNPDLLGKYLEVKGHTDDMDEEELGERIAEPSTDRWTVGFVQKDDAIHYEGRCVRSHLKDCANVLQRKLKMKALKKKLADRATVLPQEIPLYRNGERITKSDGSYQMPITVMTPQGPRTSIKQVYYVDKPIMEFDLLLLDDGVITEDILRAIYDYGGTIKGMGQDRGLGSMGKYKLVELKALD